MDLTKLEFIEQYIDTEPTENYWRGIKVIYNGLTLLNICYDPPTNKFNKGGFYIREGFIPMCVVKNSIPEWIITNHEYIIDKKEVIQESKNCIERYLKLIE